MAATATLPEARVTPPDLDDPDQYVKIEDVPILDIHVRRHVDPVTGRNYTTKVDEAQLRRIYDNTVKRTESGEIPLLRVGHVIKGARETAQPPLAGHFKPKGIGQYMGRPTILADFYVRPEVDLLERGIRDHKYILSEFPHRSAEVFRKTEPDGFIHAVAFLTQAPERDLGLLTYESDEVVELFSCPTAPEAYQMPPTPVENGNPVHAPGAGGLSHDDVAEAAAIEKITNALVTKLVAHDGYHTAMSARLIPMIKAAVAEVLGGAAEDDEGAPPAMQAGAQGATPPPPPFPADAGPPPAGEPYDMATSAPSPALAPSPTNVAMPAPANLRRGPETMANEDLIAEIGVLTATLQAVRDQNATLAAQNQAFETRLADMEKYQKDELSRVRGAGRRAQLENLVGRGVDLDIEDTLELFGAGDDETWTRQVEFLARTARRSVVDAPPIRLADLGQPAVPSQNANPTDADPIRADEDLSLFIRDHPDKYAMAQRGESPQAVGLRAVKDFLALPAEDRKKYRRSRTG
jgi:hypothetical protein